MFISPKGLRVFVYQELIDMRCGFEKLLYYVSERMRGEVNQGHLYLFFGKKKNEDSFFRWDRACADE